MATTGTLTIEILKAFPDEVPVEKLSECVYRVKRRMGPGYYDTTKDATT